jgi:hypothetical protein
VVVWLPLWILGGFLCTLKILAIERVDAWFFSLWTGKRRIVTKDGLVLKVRPGGQEPSDRVMVELTMPGV